MSISELDRILERRWPGKVRRGGAPFAKVGGGG
jgi:hypothetical protein